MERNNLISHQKDNRRKSIGDFLGLGGNGVIGQGIKNIPDPTKVVRFTYMYLMRILMIQADYVIVITSLVFLILQ